MTANPFFKKGTISIPDMQRSPEHPDALLKKGDVLFANLIRHPESASSIESFLLHRVP
jgi:hypothetical protein